MSTSSAPQGTRVALVGRLGETASEISGFLEQLGMELDVVAYPNSSTEAFSVQQLDGLREAGFALFMPATEEEKPVAMLTIGFLLAVLDRSRLCFVAGDGDNTLPALDGVQKLAFDDSGLWKLLLAREMKRAGLDVDLNKAM